MILFAVLALLLAVAGCGGSDDDSSVSKEEFGQQLKLACNEGLQERETLVRNLTREYYEEREERATPEYQAENLLKVMATYQKTTDKIADIGLPEGEEEKVEGFIKAREEAAAKVEASPIGTRDALESIFKDANEKALALDAKTGTL